MASESSSGPLREVSNGPVDDADARVLNRELSWLAFNARVLALGDDPEVPPLERAKFLAIFSQNLDEFFQVRVAGLKDQVAAGVSNATADGPSPSRLLLDIRDQVDQWCRLQDEVFLERLVPMLAEHGIVFSGVEDLDTDDSKYLDENFDDRIFPVLTPLAVDPGHPFPYISDLSLNLAVTLRDPESGGRRFARVKVPSILPRFVLLPDGERFVPLEQVIAQHLGRLFPGMEVTGHYPFRVTRNADLTVEEEEADDLLEAVEIEIRRRRFGRAVRLEIDTTMSDEVRELLVRELDVADEDVYVSAGPLDLGGLWAVHGLDRPELRDPVWTPVMPGRLAPVDGARRDFFAEMKRGDILVHHPYDSFDSTVVEFIRQAATDRDVLTIKLTIYRTSGDSPIIDALIRAAELGKQVAVLVELKARFDEAANIDFARELEKAGVHVAYGIAGLKIHTKTALVVRDEPDGIRRYCHIGTGNYNSKTARLYEDMGLLTADPTIGSDLTQLFNFFTGYGRDMEYQKLLVAPNHLRDGIEALIRGEIEVGPGRGRMIFKMNSLIDAPMIDLLYEASQAGVEIDLVVRGICGLRPGVPNMSDNIRVRSIVGRYLEHSRIYYFANGSGVGKPSYYIGSADLMGRNLNRRVEALVPVESAEQQALLAETLEVNLADDVLAWELASDDVWRRVSTGADPVETHVRLQELESAR